MGDIHISEFIEGRSQSEVAEILGVSQSAVHQMLKAKRDIYFRPTGETGSFEHYEIKRSRGKKAA